MYWEGTVSGNKICFLRPDQATITIEDIAHGLAFQTRFCGQTTAPYTIAQHSVLCARYVIESGSGEFAIEALMHDAAEAYMGDCCSPLKDLLGESWFQAEERLEYAIACAFDLRDGGKDIIKEVDIRLLFTEKRDLQPDGPDWDWGKEIIPYPERIHAWPMYHARTSFLKTFKELWNKRYPTSSSDVGISR